MTRTPWHIRSARRIGQPAVLYAALALSAPGEFSLGVMAGWNWRVAWLMPAVLSLYAAWSARNARDWSDLVRKHCKSGDVEREEAATRQRGSAIRGALVALVVATAAQITEHVLTTGATGAIAWVVIVVSAVPPLVAAHVLHLDPPEDEDAKAQPEPALNKEAGPAPVLWKVEVNKAPTAQPVLTAKPHKLPTAEEKLTLKEAAGRLGVHVTTLYRRRDAGALQVHDGPRGQLVLWSDLAPVNA
ncbi:hypothetical protein ACFVHB_20230 [Kitasatospora sp. NPDC127111]|uniref:hypothetical protein n=1 Tax=Kitasatospora sp. NPDC127111 TaxID=3345363 RepID=UPI0036371936